MLVQVALILDLLLTLRDSFNRAKNLNLILNLFKVIFFCVVIIQIQDIVGSLLEISEDFHTERRAKISKGLLQFLNI